MLNRQNPYFKRGNMNKVKIFKECSWSWLELEINKFSEKYEILSASVYKDSPYHIATVVYKDKT